MTRNCPTLRAVIWLTAICCAGAVAQTGEADQRPRVTTAPAFTTEALGRSVRGKPIVAYRWNRSATRAPILVMSAVHGDEPEASALAAFLVKRWSERPGLLGDRHLVFVPSLNPDGERAGQRGNANGVDLNRNFPTGWQSSAPSSATYSGTAALSEPESRALQALLAREQFQRVLTLHSCRRCGGVNNFDGPGGALATLMSEYNGYPPLANWAQPTPGSMGKYVGKQLGLPIVTLEIPRQSVAAPLLESNARAIESFILAAVGHWQR